MDAVHYWAWMFMVANAHGLFSCGLCEEAALLLYLHCLLWQEGQKTKAGPPLSFFTRCIECVHLCVRMGAACAQSRQTEKLLAGTTRL